jgi:hypothetical protein
MKDNKELLRHIFWTGWAIAFAYYFGQLLWFVVPLPWPFSVIASYIGGITAGALLAYLVIGRAKPTVARIVLAVVALAFVGIVSVVLNRLSSQTSIMRFEIQELRDNAARPQ